MTGQPLCTTNCQSFNEGTTHIKLVKTRLTTFRIISTLHLDSCSQKQEFDERYLGCGFPALEEYLKKEPKLKEVSSKKYIKNQQL